MTGTISVVTANIASDTSVKTAEIARQGAADAVNAAAAQSKSDFLRSQRLTEYTNYLTKATQYENAAQTYSDSVQKGSPALSQEELDGSYTALNSAYAAYVESAWRVREIATDPVNSECDKMNQYVDDNSKALRLPLGRSQVDPVAIAMIMTTFHQQMEQLKSQVSTVTRTEFVASQ
ncbi:hypothetical protein [Arthrobacter sp. Hiyo1]|uniref:hypothetical protein n=1 Tax=Arthrobacter sp. Hiyo1 TaxID=1588020 RepID=UPI0011E4CF0A|nr:hypothetical protein [Arthrobacter sp. Hiyo1]